MCGLVGVFGNVTNRAEQVFEDLLQMDVIRGPHSTGVCLVPSLTAKPKIIKDVVLPTALIQSKKYKNLTARNNVLMMGHNRWATVGEVNAKNAHPFKVKHITLSHNGTLTTTQHLPGKTDFDTDTEAIASSIAQHGIGKTWKNLNGAAVLTYWNRKEQTLNIISNEKRPFHFAYSEDEKLLIWASENEMLRYACNRRGITLKDDKVWFPEKNIIFGFTFDLASKKIVERHCDKLDAWNWSDHYTPVVYTPATTSLGRPNQRHAIRDHYRSCGFIDNDDFWGKYKREIGEDDIPFEVIKENVKEEEDNLLSKQMTYDRFLAGTFGCHFCEQHLFSRDHYDTTVMVDAYTAICGQCALVAKLNNISVSRDMLV